MGMMKNYLLKLLQQCSEEQFGQDAIEWAIVTGRVRLTYNLESDVHQCMSRYDEIIEAYRRALAQPTDGGLKPHAPMKRAVPRRGVKTSIKEKRAA